MSSFNRHSSTSVPEPSATIAAQMLRERIGQENVAQSSVLASRRLDEALSRLERASTIKHTIPAQTACASEQAQVTKEIDPANEADEPIQRERTEPAVEGSPAQTSEMSSDGIESLFGRPIDVMILSTKAKINEERVFKPDVTPEAIPPLRETEPAAREQPSPAADLVTVTPAAIPAEPVAPAPAPAEPIATAAAEPMAAASVPNESSPNATPVGETDTKTKADSESQLDFVAAWRVDEFMVPSTIDRLFLADSLAEQLAGRLAEARVDGLQTIAVTSAMPGEGRSTVAMGLALSIAFSGIRVALIDADRDGLKIASDLQLDLDHSWPEAIRSNMPLEEIAVASQADALTLLPLLDREGGADFEPAELDRMLIRLRQSFDMIVVDCGAAAIDEIALCGTVLIVRDVRRTEDDALPMLSQALHRRGVRGIGLIENFYD